MHSGNRVAISAEELKNYRKSEKADRDMFVRGLYRDIKALIVDGGALKHEVLGSIKVDKAHLELPKGYRALAITHDVMRVHFGFSPPSLNRMYNIVAGQR